MFLLPTAHETERSLCRIWSERVKAFPTSTWYCLAPSRCGLLGSMGTQEWSSTSQMLGFHKGTKLAFQARLRRLS